MATDVAANEVNNNGNDVEDDDVNGDIATDGANDADAAAADVASNGEEGNDDAFVVSIRECKISNIKVRQN